MNHQISGEQTAPMQNLGRAAYPTEPGTIAEQRPVAPLEKNRIREIHIRQVDHGYIVDAGCQTLAIEDRNKLISLLSDYFYNPREVEERYYGGKLL